MLIAAPHATLPPTDEQWIDVVRCPLCQNSSVDETAVLPTWHYVFGGQRIRRPATLLKKCSCGLVYKTPVPSMAYLSSVITALKDELWGSPYDYDEEARLLHQLLGQNFDLIDVGAAVGGILNAARGAGRRSALDLVRFGSLELRGEFIEAFLDSPTLRWSEDPYDAVTAFDIFEHLYDPNQAMRNMGQLLKTGGYLVLETGDTDTVPNGALGEWYYLSLFEHHVGWNEKSIHHAANEHGFEVRQFERKVHKISSGKTPNVKDRLRHGLYSAAPTLYRNLQNLMGAMGSAPSLPGTRDHFRAVLKRL